MGPAHGAIPTMADLDVADKRVLVRVDFNVPLDGETVVDDTRIRAALPTIAALRDQGARLVLASHLGRPRGKVDPALSLLPVAARLADLVDVEVVFAHDVVGDEVVQLAKDLDRCGILVLENLRFDPGEKAADPDFTRALAAVGEVFVNDAFGAMHRSHASITGVPQHLPSGVGLLVQLELQHLGGLLDPQQRLERAPFAAILGGAKVSDKIDVIEALSRQLDHLFVGGAMAYTFLAAGGVEVGASRVEADKLDLARQLLDKCRARNVRVHLPIDHVVAETFAAEASPTTVDQIPEGSMGLDIGPATLAAWTDALAGCSTVFWNGPMGVFEWDAFSRRDPGDRHRAGERVRPDHRGRRRQRRGPREVRSDGSGRSRVDGGGRLPRVPRAGGSGRPRSNQEEVMARRRFIAGNWKLNLGPEAAARLAGSVRDAVGATSDVTVAVFPTALSIPAVVEQLAGSPVAVGIQEIAAAPKGAFTGANSAVMARDAGCTYCLVGHSERRQLWGETDEACAAKLAAALNAGLLPILCVGETLGERRSGQVEAVVHRQLDVGLSQLQPDQVGSITVAYEPVWAIGTGETATPEQAQQVHASIRAWLADRHGAVADDVRIQYGGSVKPANAAELLSCPDIDGALVGGASLQAADFEAIVRAP